MGKVKKIRAKGLNFSNRTKYDKKRKLLTYVLKSPLCELQTFIFSKYFKISLQFVFFIIVYVHELWSFSIFCTVGWSNRGLCDRPIPCPEQGRIKLFGAPRQWKHFRPLFQAVFLSGEGRYYPPDWVKNHASQSQDRNNKYFILYIEICINNKI